MLSFVINFCEAETISRTVYCDCVHACEKQGPLIEKHLHSATRGQKLKIQSVLIRLATANTTNRDL